MTGKLRRVIALRWLGALALLPTIMFVAGCSPAQEPELVGSLTIDTAFTDYARSLAGVSSVDTRNRNGGGLKREPSLCSMSRWMTLVILRMRTLLPGSSPIG
jgi:hypothetical protein